ncbi:hypothetical protein D3C73_1644250 [compost metagenome]
MGRGDIVLLTKVQADPDRARLLPGTQMRIAGDITSRHLVHHPLLEAADLAHRAIDIDEFVVW